MCRRGNLLHCWVGVSIGATTMENSVEAPSKTKHRTTTWLRITLHFILLCFFSCRFITNNSHLPLATYVILHFSPSPLVQTSLVVHLLKELPVGSLIVHVASTIHHPHSNQRTIFKLYINLKFHTLILRLACHWYKYVSNPNFLTCLKSPKNICSHPLRSRYCSLSPAAKFWLYRPLVFSASPDSFPVLGLSQGLFSPSSLYFPHLPIWTQLVIQFVA